MPNRILKESICTSDTIDELTWFEEVVFNRLIVNCDDYGRFDGRPLIIKSRLFPLKNNVTEKAVANAIDKLSTVGLVMPYEYDGKPILQLVTWDKHQSVRNKRSKFPAIDGSDTLSAAENVQLISSECNCNQLKSNVCKCYRNPIQSESNPNPNTNSVNTELFSRFWNAYPRHVAKATAEKAFKKLKVNETLLDKMLKAIEAQKKSTQWLGDGGKYIPHPATWLNQQRWNDEAEIPIAKPKKETSFDLDEYEDMITNFTPTYRKKDE